MCKSFVFPIIRMPKLKYIFLLVTLLPLIKCNRESECTEVGFARSAGSMIHQSFESTRDSLLPKWKQEDESKIPSYHGLNSMLKNVTRSAQLLEESSKLLLSMIRKTRVGKRCPELWLLRGVEKHVVPLMNLDKQLSEELGLVMSFRCLVGSPYPNVDGTCVNQESPDLGSIGSKYLRLLTASPGLDGFSLRSSASKEKELPSGRVVSNLIRKYMKEPSVTELFSQWAYFIQRDTFGIPESPMVSDVDCCENPDHEDCAPIFLEKDDPEYSKVKCFNFKRAARAQAILGHRESMTVVSTYLDATPVYGPTNEVAFTKKTGFFGYLKVPEEEELKEKKGSKCEFPKSFEGCFPKDPDNKLIPGLTYLLSLEHNRIADVLAEINPHFDDSLLYNEARRITIALYNVMTFGEYLPMLLGDEVAKKHHLIPGADGPAAQFVPQVNPGILAGFAVAGYRNPSMITEWRSEWGETDLLDSSHLKSIEKDSYKDLLAMDVQRSRDHAVPGYLSWRRFCDPGRVLDKWEDLDQVLPSDVIKELKKIYQDEKDDIDMSVALLESPEEGAVVGKTFSCIMADQYARLRTGNRLYWEHETAMFTQEQRDVIKTDSIAGLLCRNLDIEQVPKNPFAPVSEQNPPVKCSDIPELNMTHWKDTSLIEKMKEAKEKERQQLQAEPQVEEQAEEHVEQQVDDQNPETQVEQVEEENPQEQTGKTERVIEVREGANGQPEEIVEIIEVVEVVEEEPKQENTQKQEL